MEYNDSGRLSVRAYTASGAYPVAGTVIRVTGVDENNRFINYSIITDVNGVSIFSSLPAPAEEYSLSPGSQEPPYAIYDIEASADGYYSKIIHDVPIFSGQEAVLPINMIPISVNDNGSMYPRDTLDTFVTENAFLE